MKKAKKAAKSNKGKVSSRSASGLDHAGNRTKAKGPARSKNSVRAESKLSVRTEKNARAGSAKGAAGGAGHFSKRAPVPVGPYPHARRVGDFIFVSGMGPRTPEGKHIPGVNLDAMGRVQSHDIVLQTHSVIQNIKNVLEDMGSGLEDVVDVSVFLTNMKEDFKSFNKVYGEYFAKIGPTRTTVEVQSLPTPINVELKVVAYKR